MDSMAALVPQTDLDFFWGMMESMGKRRAGTLQDVHEEEVDDASAAYMGGQEL